MEEQPDTQAERSRRVRALIAGTLFPGRPPVETGDPLDGHDLDSVGIIQLLAALEDEFRISVPPEEIRPENFQSLAGIVAMVGRLQARN